MKFSDFLQLATNPKLVQDCIEPMVEEGMVLHGSRGSCYRQSERGVALAIVMTSGLARLMDYLDEEMEGDELE